MFMALLPWIVVAVVAIVCFAIWKFIDKKVDSVQRDVMEFANKVLAPMGSTWLVELFTSFAIDDYERVIKMIVDIIKAPNTMEIVAKEIAEPIATWYEEKKKKG